MKKQKVLASAKTRGRKVIKASRSPQDLIDAFESRIKELEVNSCDNIMSSEEVTASDVVFITDSDKDIWYDDIEGIFGGEDGMVSLAELKQYWNSAKDGDPSLAYYDDFQSWLRDSVDNGYLSLIDSEAYELIGSSTDVFDEVTEGELNSKEHIGMCEITSSEDVKIYEEDRFDRYQDVGGAFGGSGEDTITLADAKKYWNENKYDDPSLSVYPSFDRWWRDTRDNFLIEASCCANCSTEFDDEEEVEGCDISGEWM